MVSFLSFLVLAILAYLVYIPSIRGQTTIVPNSSLKTRLYFYSRKHKKEIGFFATIVGALLTYYAAIDQNQTQKVLAAKSDTLQRSLNRSSGMIISLQGRLISRDSLRFLQQKALTDSTAKIASLYRQLYKLQEQATRLAQKASDNDTGGSSYCFVYILPVTASEAIVLLEHVGEYPLSGLWLTIRQVSNTKNKNKVSVNGDLNELLKERALQTKVFRVGTVAARQDLDYEIGRIPCELGKEEDYQIEFNAKNGYWNERYQLRYDSKGQWRYSFTVGRPPRGHETKYVVLQKQP